MKMKIGRTYRDVNTGKSFGTNSFAMLCYAHNNPGCELESFEPDSEETTRQKFIKVEREQSLTSNNHWTVICYLSRNGEPYTKTVEVRKEDWE